MIRYLEICCCSGWTRVVVENWDHTQEVPSPISLLSLHADLCARWPKEKVFSLYMKSFLPCCLGLSWADSRESRAEHSSQTMQLRAVQEGQTDMRWRVGKGEYCECVIRRAASLWACQLSELLRCPLSKETEFSFVMSETTPPAFRRGGPDTGSLWWHTGGAGEPQRPLPFVNLSIKQTTRYIIVVSNPGVYMIHYEVFWQMPTCHSSANVTSQILISHPHIPTETAVDLYGSEWGQDLARDPQEWSKLVCGAAHKSLPLCWSCRLWILLRLHCHKL